MPGSMYGQQLFSGSNVQEEDHEPRMVNHAQQFTREVSPSMPSGVEALVELG